MARLDSTINDDEVKTLRWLSAEALSIFSLQVVTIAGLSLTLDREDFDALVEARLTEGVVPPHQMKRFSEAVDKYLMGILSVANAPASVRVEALGALNLTPPDYSGQLSELAWRLGRTPPSVRSLPRQLDMLVFERVVHQREVAPAAATRLGLVREDSARLRRILAAFLRGTSASTDILDAALSSPIDQPRAQNVREMQGFLFVSESEREASDADTRR